MSRPPMNLIFPERTASGISKNHDGQRVIAPTRRPDGTFRQEIKIRPGYTPQEDVSLFRSSKQLELDHHRLRKGTVPGLAVPSRGIQDALRGAANANSNSTTKSAKKNAKRKDKRNDSASTTEPDAAPVVKDSWDDDEEEDDVAARAVRPTPASSSSTVDTTTTTTTTTTSTGSIPASAAAGSLPPPIPPTLNTTTLDPETQAKKLRNLRKKLVQTRLLAAKSGSGSPLSQAEQQKVDGMEQLEQEIEKLELSSTSSS